MVKEWEEITKHHGLSTKAYDEIYDKLKSEYILVS